MKKRRSINFFTGIVLILLNVLVDLANQNKPDRSSQGNAYDIGYLIGSNFIAIIGLVLLYIAYRYHKKIKSKEDSELDRSIDDIGK